MSIISGVSYNVTDDGTTYNYDLTGLPFAFVINEITGADVSFDRTEVIPVENSVDFILNIPVDANRSVIITQSEKFVGFTQYGIDLTDANNNIVNSFSIISLSYRMTVDRKARGEYVCPISYEDFSNMTDLSVYKLKVYRRAKIFGINKETYKSYIIEQNIYDIDYDIINNKMTFKCENDFVNYPRTIDLKNIVTRSFYNNKYQYRVIADDEFIEPNCVVNDKQTGATFTVTNATYTIDENNRYCDIIGE